MPDVMSENRRAAPRLWQPDWLVLRRQAEAIQGLLAHPGVALRGASVLDFGCGTRPYEDWFSAAGARYQGADIDGTHEIDLRPDGSLAAGDAMFDMVASFQVLEHVWDVATYLEEAHRVLKPGGWLLLSTHGTWFYHPHPGDYRRWTAEGLRREIGQRGFSLIEMRSVIGPLAWTTILRCFGFVYVVRRIPAAGRVLAGAAAVVSNLLAWFEDRLTPAEIRANDACVYVTLFKRTD
jgi:SAM-dependent methyltransferase